MNDWLGWHFIQDDGTLQYDMEGVKVEAGVTYRFDGEPVLCEQGLHASKRAIDALQYAPGVMICRVRLSGVVVEGSDKAVATERTVLWMADAAKALHEFAGSVAEAALNHQRELGNEPDARSWNALTVKRAWLAGKATDDELAAARDAAWAAAGVAARDAAWAAVRDAAWVAARAAARAAARDAARAAARAAQNEELERILFALAPVGVTE